ncbi:MAG: hypothetical protein IJ429_04915 [Lachnospiraceae bacterium]|nr:hypothetical protein [Lachnospiraceae bacterium]
MESGDTILTFDTLYTTNEIQILKLALPLLSASLRPYAALLIKGKELKYCMDQLPRTRIENAAFELSYLDAFLDNALPYCTQKQKELIHQIKQFKHSLDMFEKMKGMMSLFGEDGPEDISSLFQMFGQQHADNESSGQSPEDMLRSVMSEEQADLFEMFKKKFEEESDGKESV